MTGGSLKFGYPQKQWISLHKLSMFGMILGTSIFAETSDHFKARWWTSPWDLGDQPSGIKRLFLRTSLSQTGALGLLHSNVYSINLIWFHTPTTQVDNLGYVISNVCFEWCIPMDGKHEVWGKTTQSTFIHLHHSKTPVVSKFSKWQMFVDAFLPARIVCIRVNLGRFFLVLRAAKPHVQVSMGNVHQKIPVS